MEDSSSALHEGGTVPIAVLRGNKEELEWLTSSVLSIVVVGASGDLAKKKTYPSLLDLYDDNLLPKNVKIWGFARTSLSDQDLRDRIRPFLTQTSHGDEVVERFLNRCFYQKGQSYGDMQAFELINQAIEDFERSHSQEKHFNRLFYFAIPPSSFGETAVAIKKTSMQDDAKGWSRLIVEKPFGRDLESFEVLNKTLSEHFSEQQIFRIDHYLGKELVQNLTVLRFGNRWLEQIWNAQNVSCVMLTFKEPFGTDGRGGYFDQYGIIRDICQNHLLQVCTLLAMEAPSTVEGPQAGKAIRDAKVAVLNAMKVIELKDVVLGQYTGYADDETIENKNTNTPTFATIRLYINTPRWFGVPFILKAGKALNERKAEIRVQFKDAPAAEFLFQGQDCPRNELVMRMQPHEAVYLKMNVKSPGLSAKPIQSELEVNYESRFFDHHEASNPDAYTRLILDVLQGKQSSFVRDDELRRAWEIFAPVLKQIEANGDIRPIVYEQGGRGPPEADAFIVEQAGYIRNLDYVFYEGNLARKSEGSNKAPLEGSSMEVEHQGSCDVGLFGLAVMGQNLALNMAEHGFKVCVGNRSQQKVNLTIDRANEEGGLPVIGAKSPEELVAYLKKPRKLIILVQAGQSGRPVDDTVSTFARYMEPGDVLIDGGNEWFPNSIHRAKFLQPKGISFIGMGISGGEEYARKGASFMLSGPKKAYEMVEPILSKCAAQDDRTGRCVGYLGPIGAGNYVKTVHNGIEYGNMQLLAEMYDVMKTILRMPNEEMADVFDDWNRGRLSSYLIEITALILRKLDDESGEGYVLDYVLDKTFMKGTGKWTLQESLEKNVAIPTIAASLSARMMSNRKEERESAAKILLSPAASDINKPQVLNDLEAALYSSTICSFAQGLSLIKAASDEYKWGIDLGECARLWTGGCIIRAAILDDIQKAFLNKNDLVNLMVDPSFSAKLNDSSEAWRRVVALCVTRGVPAPSLTSSLTYLDTYRCEKLPTNLTQAQRDFFGGHTFERIDKGGHFHTLWTDAHKGVGDVEERAARDIGV